VVDPNKFFLKAFQAAAAAAAAAAREVVNENHKKSAGVKLRLVSLHIRYAL
jgi:hypothetical protein